MVVILVVGIPCVFSRLELVVGEGVNGSGRRISKRAAWHDGDRTTSLFNHLAIWLKFHLLKNIKMEMGVNGCKP